MISDAALLNFEEKQTLAPGEKSPQGKKVAKETEKGKMTSADASIYSEKDNQFARLKTTFDGWFDDFFSGAQ